MNATIPGEFPTINGEASGPTTNVALTSNSEFTTHILNDQGRINAARIQLAFDTCLNTLKEICTEGRYLAIVRTKLEEASFFAKKSMATNLNNQQH